MRYYEKRILEKQIRKPMTRSEQLRKTKVMALGRKYKYKAILLVKFSDLIRRCYITPKAR